MKQRRTTAILWSIFTIAVGAAILSANASAQTWQVTSADWGAGNRRVDVTNRVRQLVNGRNFQVNNQTMGTDPALGQPKVLRIRARDRSGKSRDFDYPEGQTVDSRMFSGTGFPGGPGVPGGGYPGMPGLNQLRIVQAMYGTRGRFADVTSRVQSMVRNNRLNIYVSNDTMGVDPAQGLTKELNVNYDYQGKRRTANAREKTYLVLP